MAHQEVDPPPALQGPREVKARSLPRGREGKKHHAS